VRNQISQAEENMTSLDRESQRLEREIASARVDIEGFGGRRGQIAFEFESVTQSVTALGARIDETRSLIDSKRKEEEEKAKAAAQAEAESATTNEPKNAAEDQAQETTQVGEKG